MHHKHNLHHDRSYRKDVIRMPFRLWHHQNEATKMPMAAEIVAADQIQVIAMIATTTVTNSNNRYLQA